MCVCASGRGDNNLFYLNNCISSSVPGNYCTLGSFLLPQNTSACFFDELFQHFSPLEFIAPLGYDCDIRSRQ